MPKGVRQPASRHQLLDCRCGGAGDRPFRQRNPSQLVPKLARIALWGSEDRLEPAMVLADHEWPTADAQALTIAVQNRAAPGLGPSREMVFIDQHKRARGQAHEIQ